MTEKTICPACGAPLEVPEGQDVVQCSFCGDRFEIEPGDEQPQFRVQSQPAPQSDLLAQQGDQALNEEVSDAAESAAEQYPGTIPRAEGEPMAPGFATFGSADADPGAVGLPSLTDPSGARAYDALDSEPQATLPSVPYQVPPPGDMGTQPGEPGRRTGRSPWIGIGIAVFVVACIMCACVAGVLLWLVPVIETGDFSSVMPLFHPAAALIRPGLL